MRSALWALSERKLVAVGGAETVPEGNLDGDVASVKFSFDRKLNVDLVVDQVLLDGFRAF
ncbi:hypothetical protein ART_0604 [Arthrobacter sp. PAMC 25486]|nr:hypothetical protein ART_0604 [Arthrobacter sp. PAMC 25486]